MEKSLTKVHQAFQEALEKKVFSAAQLWVGQGEKNLLQLNIGKLSHGDQSSLVDKNTLFDIASLTKVFFTTSVAMQLVEEGQLILEAPINNFFEKLDFDPNIKVHHLLSHRSGLPDWRPLYESYPKDYPKEDLNSSRLQDYAKKISRLSLGQLPGEKRVYSDLGFILLAIILEKVTGTSLKNLWQQRVAKPLALTRSFFGPVDLKKFSVAATENCPWRKKLIQGQVHDENTFALGGISTHAGLFSTAGDLEIWVHELWRVLAGKSLWLKKASLKRFLEEPKLGWDSVSAVASQSGSYFSKLSFGHLAFTGCSVWMDPRDQKYVLLLTNRVHLSRAHPQAIKKFRPKIHDLALEALALV
ncbi:MAG: serine hydrolase [Deltaproteobacteria bacterium]|nr:serine hydrolase [Deltaproteobacteria bacterium]